MSLSDYKKYRELEKSVEERRKQLRPVFFPPDSFIDPFRASEALHNKLKEEYPEWFGEDSEVSHEQPG